MVIAPLLTAQSAAIPYRVDEHGVVHVLLVTSRTRKRWIIPKGKVGPRLLASRSAEREAFEEAGVLGRLGKEAVGEYSQGDDDPFTPSEQITVRAFPLEVVDELPVWQEMEQRERRWFPLKKALRAVSDPEIRSILRAFESTIQRTRRP